MQSPTVLDQHRKVLGIIYIVFGALWAIAGLAVLGIFVAGAIPVAPEPRGPEAGGPTLQRPVPT